jgi:hypothetical protein
MTQAEIDFLRTYMRNYILDHPARFEESRRYFFMIDRYPENDARFNLVVTPVGEPSGRRESIGKSESA